MDHVRGEWELTIGFGNMKVIADFVECKIQTGMNFRQIGKIQRGKREYRISVEKFVKIILKQSFWALVEERCVGKKEYLNVEDYYSIFESQS